MTPASAPCLPPFRALRIALISEHASPLAALGGTDAGGQNVYVAQVAKCMARAGHRVDVSTRRDSKHLAAAVDVCHGMRVLHVDAGPAEHVRKEALLAHMAAFGSAAMQLMRSMAHDVVHANFFMSGLVGMQLRDHFEMRPRVIGASRRGKRVRLVVVGGQSAQPDEVDTPETGHLRRLAKGLGIADRVTFVGQRQGARSPVRRLESKTLPQVRAAGVHSAASSVHERMAVHEVFSR